MQFSGARFLAGQAKSAILIVALVCVSSSSAYAYLDPGTGSILLQVLLGGFALLAGFFVSMRNKVSGFFGRKKPGNAQPSERPSSPPTRSDAPDV